MLEKIPGNVPEDSGGCSRRFRGIFEKIPGNVVKDSGECSTRFRGMFTKIPGNVMKDFGECSRRFQGMFRRIPGNPNFDLFLEILACFLPNFAVKLLQNNRKKHLLSNSSIKKFS